VLFRANQLRIVRAGKAYLLLAAVCCGFAAPGPDAAADDALSSLLETANWQAPISEQITDPDVIPDVVIPIPPQDPTALPPAPLLDSMAPTEEEIVPPFGLDGAPSQRRGVRPYGGGHPTDWPWGCGGSPFRTGPGWCDDWSVGCRWDVAVDGMVMLREDADLAALEAGMRAMDATGTIDGLGGDLIPMVEQFDHGPGGRVSFISKFPHYNWQMHAGYEGIEEWNASVVFPKTPLPPLPTLPFPPLTPPLDQLAFQQRSLHYRSTLHSGELNFVRDFCSPVWRPYCGVRYVKFEDEINDFLNQEAPPPFIGDPAVFTTDRINIVDIENNLIGFQIGLRHDLWRPMRRLSLEGFVNAGVYYNRIKYSNFMGELSRRQAAAIPDSFSGVFNNDVRELSEISYIGEASLSGVCRLNKCWALRAGYQALWITDLHIAEDAYLNNGIESRDLFFHGWHAGVEHRR
jgi:hypothetical protein